MRRWRTGRKLGRTIYLQVRDEPSDDDILLGMVDMPSLGRMVVDALNGWERVQALNERSLADLLVSHACRCGPPRHERGFPECAGARSAARTVLTALRSEGDVVELPPNRG